MKRISLILSLAVLLSSCGKVFKSKQAEQQLYMNVALAEAPLVADHEKDKYAPATTTVATNGALAMDEQKPDKNSQVITTVIPSSPTRVETKEPLKIIKNAHISYQVDSTDRSHARISQLLTLYQAYFGSDSRMQTGDQIQQNMVIRVPAEHFDVLVEALMKESIYTNSKNITADDVTAEFVDIEARLKSKKEVEKRYMELLSRAQKVPDVIEVESNLRVIREEIESTEGRLKLMKDQIGYSTIDLAIYQKVNVEIQPESGMGHRIMEAGVNGWRGMESFLLAMIDIWPLLIVAGILLIWIRVRMKRKKAMA